MIEILSWNIQGGRGVDGRVDLPRIAGVVEAMGHPPVVCFQEVASRFPEVDDGTGADQPAVLAQLLAGYVPVYGAVAEYGGGPRRFGNLVLTRWPVVQVFRHLLPRVPDPGRRHSPRGVLEVVLDSPAGPLRVMTTHLEFHSAAHRAVQVERLRELQADVGAHARLDLPPEGSKAMYAHRPRPADAVLCGDFNFVPQDPLYTRMQAPLQEGAPAFRDAWPLARGDAPRAPTCGVADREQWPQGPHARDYFFVTEGLYPRVAAVEVDTGTEASDHQPLKLALREA